MRFCSLPLLYATAAAAAAPPATCPLYVNGTKSDCGLGSRARQRDARVGFLTRHLPPGDLCFFGDSLTRQLFVEVACEFGAEHEYTLDATSRGFTFANPSRSKIAGEERALRYQFSQFDGDEAALDAELRRLRGGSCGVVVVGKGTWQVKAKGHALNATAYGAQMRLVMNATLRLGPRKLIFQEIAHPAYGLQTRLRDICVGPGTSSSKLELVERLYRENPEPDNEKVQDLNEKLRAAARDFGFAVLGFYDVTRKNPCDHVCVATRSAVKREQALMDPVHFCDASTALRQSVDLLLAELRQLDCQ